MYLLLVKAVKTLAFVHPSFASIPGHITGPRSLASSVFVPLRPSRLHPVLKPSPQEKPVFPLAPTIRFHRREAKGGLAAGATVPAGRKVTKSNGPFRGWNQM